ncbi:DMT family transporter [Ferrovibrio sp. MS7]|jgi:drug/metabolite transporter (DMT)-like permease|uniref:DMT family transporter n=1 Tax=Ferrovibrio plantarum TaxID=3119164 RepID=UPI001B70EA47|nr:DMT family transporter [Ferrovibrio sp.]
MSDLPASTTAPGANTLPRAMALMLISCMCFTAMHGAIGRVTQEVHPFEAAFFRNLFGLLVLMPAIIKANFAPFRTTKLHLHAIRGLANGTSMLMFFSSLAITPLAEVTALGYAAPLFATIGAAIVLREKIRARRIAALVVGFIGMVVVLRPGFGTIGTGQLLVLGATVLWAVSVVDIKILSRTDSSLTIATYMVVFILPISLVAALPHWQTPTLNQLIWLFFIGALGSGGQLLYTEAMRLGETSVLMPLDFTKLIFASLLGFFAFAQVPDMWTWIGGTIIFASTVYISYREHQIAKAAARH